MDTSDRLVLQGSRISRAEALAREIEHEISMGVLSTGDRLGTKDDLRQRFNVAVATVNEAIKLLDASRLRRGPMIMGFQWTEATMADYHEVRSALEPLVCRHAGRHRKDADIRALKAILADMERHLDQPLVYVRYNTAFHRRIAKMSPNAPLRSLYVTLLDFYENDLEHEQLPPVLHADNVGVHRQLLAAIEKGDAAALEAAIARHDAHRISLGMFEPAESPAADRRPARPATPGPAR